MISKTIMDAQAELAVKNACNSSWRNRGKLTLEGELKELPIKHYWARNGEEPKVLGMATVGFYKFEIPMRETFMTPFIGFMLAVAKVGKKTITATNPVFDKRDFNYDGTVHALVHRFCPKCNSLDTVKQRSRVAGPECVHVTYYCKCGYKDHDVID